MIEFLFILILFFFLNRIKTIFVKGMGASIPKCVKLALNLIENYSDITYEIITSTVPTKS